MSAVIHHALLALAILALGGASLRAVSAFAPTGLDRAIATAVLAVSLAVLEALVLGLAGLGANTIALATVAGLTYAIVVLVFPPVATRPGAELATWFSTLRPAWRLCVAAAVGAGLVWVAWLLRHPSIGYDSSIYHYVEIAGWIHNGRPGSILALSYDLPYGNYPLTDEVAQTWAVGISRSFVPLALWNPALMVLLGAAVWHTARNLKVPAGAAALASAAVVVSPMLVHQLNEPQTDVPALTWVACTAALATGAQRSPPLLAVGLLAAGLAIGTKTTTAIVVLAALATGLWLARGELRRRSGLLAISLVGAIGVGGVWYLRNLFEHGSPLWPFTPAPWGDPTPAFLKLVRTSLLDRPSATLDGHLGMYAGHLGGGVALLVGLVLVLLRCLVPGRAAVASRRSLVIATGVALLAVFAWSLAPGTGLPNAPGLLFALSWPFSTLRYLLPALGLAAIAVALAAREKGVTGAIAALVLAVSVAWSVIQDAKLGFPYAPAARTLVLGALAGTLAIAALSALAHRIPPRSLPAFGPRLALIAAILAALVGAPFAIAAHGYVKRHAGVAKSTALDQGVVAWLASRPGYQSSHQPIEFAARAMSAPLTGDQFTHPLELIPPDAACSQVLALERRSIVIVADPSFLRGLIGERSYSTGRCLAGRQPSFREAELSVYLPR